MKLFFRNIRFIKFLSAAAMVAALTALMCAVTFAADAEIAVTGGDEAHKSGETSMVKATISSSEQIGTYYIELEYDKDVAAYVGGADNSQESLIVLTGSGTDKSVTYSISLKNTADGAAGVKVKSAVVNDLSGNAMNVTADAAAVSAPDIPVLGSVQDENGQTLYILDQKLFVPDVIAWDYKTVQGFYEDFEVTYVTDISGNINVLGMTDGNGSYSAFAVNGAGSVYPLNEFTDSEGEVWTYTSSLAALGMLDGVANTPISDEYTVYAIDRNGNGGFYNIGADGRMIPWEESTARGSGIPLWVIIAVAAVLAAAIIIAVIVSVRRRKLMEALMADDDDMGIEFVDIEPDDNNLDALLEAAEHGTDRGAKHIDPEDVLRRAEREASDMTGAAEHLGASSVGASSEGADLSKLDKLLAEPAAESDPDDFDPEIILIDDEPGLEASDQDDVEIVFREF